MWRGDAAMLKILGRIVIGFFVLLGLITAIDLATAGRGPGVIGGTPLFNADETPDKFIGGRDVRFPSFLEQGGRRAAVLDEDYFFCDRRRDVVIRIPRGFVTDFASIPGVARILIDRLGPSLEPAGVHDWLYAAHEGADPAETEANRRLADDIFLDALTDNGAGLATRWIMYAAVRVFGGEPYSGAGDWDGRFRDPVTNDTFTAPLTKAKVGIVARNIECDNFFSQAQSPVNALVGCYSTDARLLFADDAHGGCDPGDGMIIPR